MKRYLRKAEEEEKWKIKATNVQMWNRPRAIPVLMWIDNTNSYLKVNGTSLKVVYLE